MSKPTLEAFCQTLRDYQTKAVEKALTLCAKATPRNPGRMLMAAPTGSGKGTVELALLRALGQTQAGSHTIILTPSLEVVRGFLERCGAPDLDGWSPNKIAKAAGKIGISTPVRYRNEILLGTRQVDDVIIYDEAHHAIEGGEVAGTLFAMAPAATWIGFTATPFRGTPRGTIQLREAWGEPEVILTLPDAIERGYCVLPKIRVKALVDDDQIRVSQGKFVIKSVTKEVTSRIDAILQGAARMAKKRPTVLVVPSTEVALSCGTRAKELGILVQVVTQKTKVRDRQACYRKCRDEKHVLVVIDLLREGVDFPWLRCMVDASPTLSPVKWMQRIGRVMRPGERGFYVCVCRNVERHAYLLAGAIPPCYIAEAQQAFELPTKRSDMRALGFESLGKFKQIDLPLRGGLRGGMWFVYAQVADGVYDEFLTLLHPGRAKPINARRTVVIKEDGTKKWGKWTRCSLPGDLQGFATSTFRSRCTDKQLAWWKRSAATRGLDETVDPAGRQFEAMPALFDLKARF